MELMSFTPLYMERVWGGRGLELKLGRSLPEGKVIGESWELVDREGEQSVVAEGTHKGKTIRELLENSGADILGLGLCHILVRHLVRDLSARNDRSRRWA